MEEANKTDTDRFEKAQSAEIRIDNRAIKFLENFWYHYKWHFLGAVFLLFVIITIIVQTATKEDADIKILMAGPYRSTLTQRANMKLGLAEVLGEDYNGDGEKIVEIIDHEIYSEEQIKALGNATFSGQANADNLKSFHNLVMAGEYSVCIIDEWLYRDILAAGGIRPLSELFGENIPAGSVDGYAIRLSSLPFANTFSGFSELPDSMVICLRTKGYMNGIFNKDKAESEYQKAEKLFKSIVEYRPADE